MRLKTRKKVGIQLTGDALKKIKVQIQRQAY